MIDKPKYVIAGFDAFFQSDILACVLVMVYHTLLTIS